MHDACLARAEHQVTTRCACAAYLLYKWLSGFSWVRSQLKKRGPSRAPAKDPAPMGGRPERVATGHLRAGCQEGQIEERTQKGIMTASAAAWRGSCPWKGGTASVTLLSAWDHVACCETGYIGWSFLAVSFEHNLSHWKSSCSKRDLMQAAAAPGTLVNQVEGMHRRRLNRTGTLFLQNTLQKIKV